MNEFLVAFFTVVFLTVFGGIVLTLVYSVIELIESLVYFPVLIYIQNILLNKRSSSHIRKVRLLIRQASSAGHRRGIYYLWLENEIQFKRSLSGKG